MASQRRLRDAVSAYERFRDKELGSDQDVPVCDTHELVAAQAEVEDAEADLWRLRGELVDWARPSWAPKATLVADWFSDEDQVYDEL